MANFKSVFMFLSLQASKKHTNLAVNGSNCPGVMQDCHDTEATLKENSFKQTINLAL